MKNKILLICMLLLSIQNLYSQLTSRDSIRLYRETFLSPLTYEDSLKSISDLGKSIDDLLKNRYLRNAKYSIAVYSLDRKEFLYTNNMSNLLTPASNTKLYTTFVAMRQLSKNFYLTTEVFTDGMLVDSIIEGNLYLVGRGDGRLNINDLDFLAEEISNLGIRRVTGKIYADDTYFDNVWEREDFANDVDRVVHLPPITSLSIENNTVTVLVKAGSGRGRYVDVQLIPNSETFSRWVTAKVALNGAGIKDSNFIKPEGGFFGDEYYAMANQRASVRVSTKFNEETGKQHFSISGSLSRNRSRSYRFHIIDPPLAVAGALKDRLNSSGIIVEGAVERGRLDTVPINRQLFLAEKGSHIMKLIEIINKESNNYQAENLFKLIGASAGGQDSTAKMTRFVTATMMKDLEIPFEGCLLNDGSGLSRRSLLSAESIINLLIRIDELGLYNDFAYTLPIAGIDGTLKKRMRGTTAQNNLRAKTGTLRNVSAFSGYVHSLEGERLAFSIIFNGNSVSSYKETENQIGILLSQFFYYNIAN